MDREYYSLPEAAERLGISRIAVFKRVKKGQLAALRFGRNWAVPASALEAAAAPPPASPRVLKPKKEAGVLPPPPPADAAPAIETELL